MATASFAVTIGRPPAEVLAYVADIRNTSAWLSFVDSVELMDGHSPGEPGARFLVTAGHLITDDVVMDYETTKIEPERSVSFSVKHPKLTATDTYTLAPSATGTELTYTTDITRKGLNKLTGPLDDLIIKAVTSGFGKKLKAEIEKRS